LAARDDPHSPGGSATFRAVSRRRSSTLGRAVRIAIGTGAALLAAEGLLRLLDLPAQAWSFLGPELGRTRWLAADDVLFWKLRPDAPDLDVNALGLRGRLPDTDKLPSDLRVVCVGDSCTFGSGVDLDDAYGLQLERQLQAARPDQRVEVVIAGTPGYSTWQNRRVLEMHARRLQPDYVVLYCGAWNDYVAAVGASDRERACASWLLRTRVAKLLAAWAPGSVADRDQVLAAFDRGEAPHGRRVPLPEFAANLKAMAAIAKDLAAGVCLIVPPLTAATRARQPVAADYAAVVRELAAEMGTDLVDGPALFAAAEAEHAGAAAAPGDESLCFHDWVHPSAYGHGLLARALTPLVERARPIVPSTRTKPNVTSLQPAVIETLAGADVHVRGTDLAGVDLVRVGTYRQQPRPDGAGIAFSVPVCMPAGRHEVVLLGAFGSVAAGRCEVRAPALAASCRVDGARAELRVSGQGPPGWRGSVFVAPARRAVPLATRYGPFELGGDPPGGWPDPELPFPWSALPHAQLPCVVGTDGRFEVRREFELGADLAEWWVQAAFYDGTGPVRGCLSQCVRGSSTPR